MSSSICISHFIICWTECFCCNICFTLPEHSKALKKSLYRLNCSFIQCGVCSAKFDIHVTWVLGGLVMPWKKSHISTLAWPWLWGEITWAAIAIACCSNPWSLEEMKSLLSNDSVSDTRDTGEGTLVIVQISQDVANVVLVVVVGAVVLAAVLAAAVRVAGVVLARVAETAAVVVLKHVAVVVAMKCTSRSMSLLSAAVMSLIDLIVLMIIGSWLSLRRSSWTQLSVTRDIWIAKYGGYLSSVSLEWEAIYIPGGVFYANLFFFQSGYVSWFP